MYTIHMFPDGRVQLVDQRTVPHTTRHVSLEAILEVFQAQTISSPALPKGTIQYWRGNGFSVVALQHPAHIREMYMYEQSYRLPVPDTLFLFRVLHREQGEITLCDSAVFAMDGPWQGDDTQLYGFPYGNVFDEHTICWGDYNVTLPNFYNIDTMMDMFLGTPFNTDLAGHFDSGSEALSLDEFWSDLDQGTEFPVAMLEPVCVYKDLQQFMAEDIF